MFDTAIFVAAGLGSRFSIQTKEKPKGFITIFGKTLIQRSIDALLSAGIKRILIGTGHHSEFYEALAVENNSISCVKSYRYNETSSMYTLYNMREHIDSPFILLESDLLYDPSLIKTLQQLTKEDAILMSGKTNSGDEVYIETDDSSNLVALSKRKEDLKRIDGELIGISAISLDTYKMMCRYYESCMLEYPKMDYESAMMAVSKNEKKLYCLNVGDTPWCEIDNLEHYQRAINEIYPRIISK